MKNSFRLKDPRYCLTAFKKFCLFRRLLLLLPRLSSPFRYPKDTRLSIKKEKEEKKMRALSRDSTLNFICPKGPTINYVITVINCKKSRFFSLFKRSVIEDGKKKIVDRDKEMMMMMMGRQVLSPFSFAAPLNVV